MAAASAESILKMSMAPTSNASSLCNCNGSSRRPVPPVSQFTVRRKADSASRVRAFTSSFLGSMRFCPEPAKMSPLPHKQRKKNFSVFAMAAVGFLVLNDCICCRLASLHRSMAALPLFAPFFVPLEARDVIRPSKRTYYFFCRSANC